MLKRLVILAAFCVVLASSKISRLISADVRIVGGKDADIANFPWQISLQQNQQHFCGGFLISNIWVVTAAHCINSASTTDLNIRAGSSRRDSGGQIIRVDRVIVHPNSSVDILSYDIALLRLKSPVTVSPASAAIIPEAGKAEPVGALLTVTGWGVTVDGGKTEPVILQQVSVPILSPTDCKSAYEGFSYTSHMFCAGIYGTGGKDSCSGDSGGPAVANGEVIGVVSWGNGCAQPNFPGIYAKVSIFRDWIEKVTGI